MQIPGLDFDKTFSPVARFELLHLLLALATLEDWHIHQMDVKSVFLNGKLKEEIFMEQLKGFIVAGQEAQVCCLKKVIYGLKQASHMWNLQFHGVLIGLDFMWTFADVGVYVCHKHEGDGVMIIILYVDDITMMGALLENIKRIKKAFSKCYDISDLGEIRSYLGMCIVQSRADKVTEIDQSGYIKDVLKHFGMTNVNPHGMPLPAGADVHLIKYDGMASQSDIRHYQSLIGSLMYVQIGTCPDVLFAVSHLVLCPCGDTRCAVHTLGILCIQSMISGFRVVR